MNKRSGSRLLRYTTSTAIHHLYAFCWLRFDLLYLYTVMAMLIASQAEIVAWCRALTASCPTQHHPSAPGHPGTFAGLPAKRPAQTTQHSNLSANSEAQRASAPEPVPTQAKPATSPAHALRSSSNQSRSLFGSDDPRLVLIPEHHNGREYLWEMPYKEGVKSDFSPAHGRVSGNLPRLKVPCGNRSPSKAGAWPFNCMAQASHR